ncbi:uncharacterized protein LOC115452703 [Manduca sexta]|uniref:uncharacterized protein LOC115452703 n=1 Tax=Manduca sexta TaxID=7130 RepID=UPI00188FD29B|nr:uncharacterized protein LOC115452703 [Manduca sexta]
MPPDSTLLKIYDKITIGKCSYCFLCFRTESESKLKVPQPFLKSTTSLSTLGNITNTPPRICYMCERLAIAAAKFRKAVFFAKSIDMLFKGMMQSSKYQSEVRRLLKRDEPVDPVEFDRHRMLFVDELELTSYRKTMQLQHTDVVVIDSQDVFTTDPNTTITKLGDSCEQTQPIPDTIDITEDTNSSETDIPTNVTTTPTDDVIILEDDASNTKTRTRSCEFDPKKDYKRAKIKDKTHEEIKETPKLVPMNNLMPETETIGYLHPIIRQSDGKQVVPTLSAHIINGQLLFQDKEILPKPLVIENNTILVPTTNNFNSIDELIPNNENIVVLNDETAVMEVQDIVDKIVVERLDDIERQRVVKSLEGKQLRQVVVDDENKVVKEPLMKTDRIDWEDKIPMDVISFMDATDPNPPSYIKPLMPSGAISNVMSLKDKPKSQIKEEVIDLC